ILDQAAGAAQLSGFAAYQAKNGVALERLKTDFKGKVEVIQLPAPVLRDLKKLSVEVIREQSEKTPMAKKVHASFTRFQGVVSSWDNVAEGAYRQLVVGCAEPARDSIQIRSRGPGATRPRPARGSFADQRKHALGTAPFHCDRRRSGGGRGSFDHHQRSVRHRAAKDPVANVHD